MIDMLMALSVISVIILLSVPLIKIKDYSKYNFFHEYLYYQSKAMANKNNYLYENISFNEKGNVKKAETIRVDDDVYVVELGTGKLVKK